ncbi:MAG: hypothetical protein ACI3YK_02155 [Eubacteriales bacterium]
MSNREEQQKPSAGDLLRRLRSDMGQSGETGADSGQPVGEQEPKGIPDIQKEEPVTRKNADQPASKGNTFSLEEFYGFKPLVTGTRSNPGPREEKPAAKRPTRKVPKQEEKKSRKRDDEFDLMSIFGMEEREDASEAEVEPEFEEEEDFYDEDTLSFRTRRKYTEYTDFSQNKGIFADYRKKFFKTLADLLLCIVLMLLVFGLEYSSLLPFDLPSFFSISIYPTVGVLLEIQILVLGLALKYRDFFRGGLELITARATPESALFLSAFLTALLYLIQIWTHQTEVRFFGLPAMLSILLYTVYSLLMLLAELRSFRVVASKSEKSVLYRMTKDEAKMEIAEMSRYLPFGNKYLSVTRTEKVSGFYKNTYASSRVKRWSGVLVLLTLIVAAGFGLFGFFRSGSVFEGILTGYVTLLLCLPMSIYFYYSYPMYHLSLTAGEEDSAVIGTAALEDHMPPANITLSDADIFPKRGVHLDRIKLYGTMPYDKVLRFAAAVLCPAGGSLSKVLESIMESDTIDDMEYLSVSDDGIEAAVEGKHVLMGTYHYIVRNHLMMPADGDTPDRDCVNMYMAVNNEVTAKLELTYRPSPTFARTLNGLFDSGMTVVIKTFDPNIDLSMLCNVLNIDEKMPIKVIHTQDPLEPYEVKETVESSIVTLGGIHNLMGTLNACSRTRHVMGICMALSVISILTAGIVMGVVLTMTSITKIPAHYLALYQLFWLIPGLIITKVFS